MGVLQALEAVKVIAAGLHLPFDPAGAMGAAPGSETPSGAGRITASLPTPPTPPTPTLLLFSGATIGAPGFRSVRMRSRRKDCFACGENGPAGLTLDMLRSGNLDYVAFCGGMSAPVKLLKGEERISAREYSRILAGPDHLKPHVLLDVREKELFDIASIDGAMNVPYSKIQSTARSKLGTGAGSAAGTGKAEADALPDWLPPDLTGDAPIYVVCRVGNDSQVVAKQLVDAGLGRDGERWIGDIRGGMRAWRNEVDQTLPFL